MAKCTGIRCPMQDGYKVDECNHKDCPYRTEPITNADKIRALTDNMDLIDIIKCPYTICQRTFTNCFECKLDWLQQPAEEGER